MKRDTKIFITLLIFFLAVLAFFCKKEYENLDYFLPLANSILHGKFSVNCNLALNELVNIKNRCFVVYPPAPAIALLPFALLFGSKLSQVYPGIIYASLAGALFYLVLRRLTKEPEAIALSLFLMFGTNFFMISLIGRSWYFAHVTGIFFMVISVLFALKKKPYLAGIFLGLAGMSRLPMLFAFPAVLYLLKPTKKDYIKFFIPVSAVVLIFLAYNYYRFGSIFQTGYSLIPGVLDEAWYKQGIMSLSYIPRNLKAMFLQMPEYISVFPWFVPKTYAMALWLTSPALLLLVFGLKDKRSLVMMLSFALIIFTDLMHGAVGFSQFGYRFALDGMIFLIIAMIPALESQPILSLSLIFVSVVINFYAVLEYALGYFHP